ncbi:MAG: Uma2 family endonuclease [bacterium]|nr:Uma2 family endonuclease [bacterium]
MPSTNHAVVQVSLIGELLRQGDELSILSELSLELDGTPFVPDISVYRRLQLDPLCDQVKRTEPPLLAVEILSPTQPLDELIKKASAYLEAGVQACWLVQPSLQNITVFLPGQKPRTHTEGEVTDSATGITVKLEDVFRPFS